METSNNIRNHYGAALNESGGCHYDIRNLWKSVDLEYQTLPAFIDQHLTYLIMTYNSF